MSGQEIYGFRVDQWFVALDIHNRRRAPVTGRESHPIGAADAILRCHLDLATKGLHRVENPWIVGEHNDPIQLACFLRLSIDVLDEWAPRQQPQRLAG